jgi:phosphate transport system substrate-binding protein
VRAKVKGHPFGHLAKLKGEHPVKIYVVALTAAAVAAGAFAAAPAYARDEIKVAGSSTVLPYAKIVAEEFQKSSGKFKVVVESGGSGAGINQFCKGVGPEFIDIANASRKIKPEEVDACKKAGVSDIIEIKFGYDGIVFASDLKGPEFKFTPKDWFLALGANVPVDGKIAANSFKTWKDVNPAFPAWEIVAYIPGEKHGTREVFEEKVLIAGCKAAGADKLIEAKAKADGKSEEDAKKAVEAGCKQVRKDDGGKHAVDIDGDYTETLARLQSNKQGIGVFGLAFAENNADKLRVATMSDVKPSVDTIAEGKYPVSRPLFFYVKKAHLGVIPGMKDYVDFFTSAKMIGEDGPLANYGLVPLPKKEFDELQKQVKDMKTMASL